MGHLEFHCSMAVDNFRVVIDGLLNKYFRISVSSTEIAQYRAFTCLESLVLYACQLKLKST